MKVQGIDHLQLAVADPAESARFYAEVLGMEIYFEDLPHRIFLEAGRDILTLQRHDGIVRPERIHFGFLARTQREMEQWSETLRAKNVPIESERRTEAGSSIYLRDPDGYLIEIFHVSVPPA